MSPSQFTALYKEYVTDISQYFFVTPRMSEEEAEQTAQEYLEDPYAQVMPIYAGEEATASSPAGFLIVCRKGGDCHPNADYFIAQLYVKKEYREKKLAQKAVSAFVSSHPGIYCYDVLLQNLPAILFWRYMEKKYGWEKVKLREIRPLYMTADIDAKAFRAI